MLVLNHRPELIEPGHLFLTPYSHVADQAKTERREFYPCQTGAHIYDQNGVCQHSTEHPRCGLIDGRRRTLCGQEPVLVATGTSLVDLHPSV